MKIPKEAKPHEVAILLLWADGMNTKQIASALHYKKTQPIRRVIAKWELELMRDMVGAAKDFASTL